MTSKLELVIYGHVIVPSRYIYMYLVLTAVN